MRTIMLAGLIIVSLMAACGDSSSDDDNKGDDTTDAGGITDVGDAGELPMIDDDNLSECDKGDPCCFGSDEYDYTRCMPTDGGAEQDAGAGK